jgi:multicomponent Na+:H+ antiporter subunit A
MASSILVLFPFYALLGGICLLLVFGRWMSSRSKGILAVAACLAALGGVVAVALSIQSGRALELTVLSWDGPLVLAYHVDGLSLMFALMATAIGAVILLYSIGYMARDPGSTRFYVLMLVFIGLVHLVYTANLLIFYLSWEVIGLCSFLLVGFWYQQKEAVQGARKVLVMTHLAGYGLLAAILLIFARTGSLLWTDPRLSGSLTTGLFLLILVAAVAKSVQFPLHTWIPDAMAAPTPVSALLHAACYVKAGVYLIARLHSLGAWPAAWGTIVIWIGTITMIVGVLYAMIQTDLKRMLAFHTVSQIGYMMVGLGLGTPLGIAAGLLHCLNHAFFKGGLFLGAGAVQHSTGTKDMDQLGGLARRMPRTALFWLVSAGAISGLPLMSGFVSKWLLYNAALEAGQIIPALVAWVVSILTVFSFLKATSSVFLGAETAQTSKAEEAPASMRWGMGLMAAGSLILGVAPQLAIQFLINPVLPALGLSPVTQVTWFGMSTATGSWWSTGGLILAVVALGGGVLVYALAAQPGRQIVPTGRGTAAWGGVFTGGEPLSGSGRLPASDFSAIIKHNLAPFYAWVDMDRYYLAIWHSLLKVSRAVGRASAWMEKRAVLLMLGLSMAAILLVVALAPSAGTTAAVNESVPLIITVVTSVAWLTLVISASASPKARSKVLLMALSGGLAVGGLVLKTSALRLALLESAALLALLLVWQSSQNRAANRAYLAAVLVSTTAVIGGSLLLNAGQPGWAAALLFAGFALKLGLVPLYLWLPQVAEATPAPVAGLVVSVIDVAAFGDLWLLKPSDALPAITGLWLALALLSALGGALLMLAQHNLKRLLAFSSIEDMGYLVLGVFAAGQWGMAGALTGVMVHALAKALLFTSLVAPEVEGAVSLEQQGVAVRYPLAGVGFLVGMLAVLGVPPMWGFAARWRLYTAAAEISPLLLFAFLLASGLALLAYARVLAIFWWGPSNSTTREPPARSTALNAVLLVLILALLAGGLWPELITALSRLLGG